MKPVLKASSVGPTRTVHTEPASDLSSRFRRPQTTNSRHSQNVPQRHATGGERVIRVRTPNLLLTGTIAREKFRKTASYIENRYQWRAA